MVSKAVIPTKGIRVVGRRRAGNEYTGGLEAADGFLKMAAELRGSQPFAPRGVFRFHSHEEADEWMMKMLTRRNAGRPPSKT